MAAYVEELAHTVASFLANRCDLSRRNTVITKLIMLAAIDHEISEVERDWIFSFAESLAVSQYFVGGFIQRLIDGSDLDF